jgi:Lipopolysaccharide biosynthesis proteins, LPS:glycosyltransferases
MTIVYASDKNYAPLTAISAVSALKHNPGSEIVLIGYNLEQDAQDTVRTRVEKAGGKFVYYNVSEEIEKVKATGCNGYTSYAAYARIFIPNLLKREGRVLYLDGDTLVNDSLSELLETDMKGKPIALAVDCVPFAFKKVINVADDVPYFNSGVMVIDLDAWRRRDVTARFIAELNNPNGPNPLGDQDIFVRVFHDDIALIAPKWNFISHFFLFSYKGLCRVVGGEKLLMFSKEDYKEAHRDPRVFHFLGQTLGRPWYTSSRHPMRDAYRKAAAEAGLAEFVKQTRPMSIDYKLQYWLHRLLPQFAFDIICNCLYRVNIWRNYKI